MDYQKIILNIQPRAPWVDVFTAQLGELGCDSFEETKTGMNAYIPFKEFNPAIKPYLADLKAMEEVEVSFSLEFIEAKNWNEVWESSFDPILVEDWCSIVAPFHQNVPQTEYQVIIEPKMSFGTGHHQTTYMMVDAMREMNLEGKDLLDMGSGTGILAILAKKMKANYVEAIDIEDWAVENCVENCERNGVEMIVKLGGKEQISSKQFDVILANINRNILLDQIQDYANNINTGGTLAMSGFLFEDENIISEAAHAVGFSSEKKYTKDNWLCLVFSKK